MQSYLHNNIDSRADNDDSFDNDAYLQAKEIHERVNKNSKFIMHATDKRVTIKMLQKIE